MYFRSRREQGPGNDLSPTNHGGFRVHKFILILSPYDFQAFLDIYQLFTDFFRNGQKRLAGGLALEDSRLPVPCINLASPVSVKACFASSLCRNFTGIRGSIKFRPMVIEEFLTL